MTHPALFSIEDAVEALGAALDLEGLTIIQRRVLADLRDDLNRAADINTVSDVVDLALRQAENGHY